MTAGAGMVLTWHSISSGAPPLCVAPGKLEAQLDLLERAGLEVVPYGELVAGLRAGHVPARPVVALTFDDGYRDFAEAALPILERRRLPATLFATSDADRARLPGGLDAPLLGLDELADLAGRGVSVGAHSVRHADLTALDDAALERELQGSRRALEDACGRPVEHFAYPFGRFDARVRAAVAARFRSACTTELARVPDGADPYAIPRVDAFYLRSPLLRMLLANGRPDPYLRARRLLRRLRGSEPRAVRLRAAPAAPGAISGLGKGPRIGGMLSARGRLRATRVRGNAPEAQSCR